MLDPVFNFFEKFVSDFSWRRLFLVVAVLMVTLGGIYIFESNTSYFKLQQVDKEISLLERLGAISRDERIVKNEQLKATFENLAETLRKRSEPEDENQVLSSKEFYDIVFSVTAKKVFAAISFWMVLFLILVITNYTNKQKNNNLSTFMGMTIVAAPFVILAAFIPTFEAIWINYYLYPLANVVLVTFLTIAWSKRKGAPT